MLDLCDVLAGVTLGQLDLEALVEVICQQCNQSLPVKVEVNGFILGKLRNGISVVEDVVEEDFADNEAGDHHADVLPADVHL